MKPNPGPGKLIALEGLDGAGTTTQSALLAEWLQRYWGKRVYVTREPSQGPAGAQIRSVLSHRLKMDGRTLAALFATDRIDHLYHQGGVIKRLEAGKWVIMDRYYLSSFAYQALSLTQEELRWLWYLHSPCPIPDMTIFLDVPVEVCLERIALNRGFHFELFEKEDILQTVHLQYLDSIQRFRKVGHNIQTIEGLQSPKEVTEVIRDRLRTLWDTSRLPPEQHKSLWRKWSVLHDLRWGIEKRLGLYLLTIRRLTGGRGDGYQLVFAGKGSEQYRVNAYLGSRGGAKIIAQGPQDDTLMQLRDIIQRPTLWDREAQNA